MLKKACIVFALLNFCFHAEAQKKATTTPGSVSNPSNPSDPSTPTETFVGTYNNELIDQIYAITNKVEETQNFVNLGNLSPDSNIALPFGIIKDVGAARYSICIDSMKFKSNGAYFSACAAIEFPAAKKKIAFRASNIKFNPAGVIGGEQARLYLATSHTIQINPTVILRLLNDNSNWVEWDCNGFKAIHLKGHFEFSKGKLLPDTTVMPGAKIVKASFEIYTQNIHEFVTTMNITPFCVNGLKGWGFKVTDATVDMSELKNGPNFSFPADYPAQNLASLEAWTGFSLKSLVIRLPREVSKTGKKTEIAAYNMLIDNMGVSGIFQVNNLVVLNEGSASGWAFSVDEIGVGFITNRINSGHFKGKIQVPITKENEQFQYTANIHHSYTTGQTNYNFVVAPATNVTFGVFGAKVNLNNNSNIAINVVDGNFRPSANLSGQISFDTEKMSSNGGYLGFENLIIVPEAPYITNGIFTLGNIGGGQTKAHNYPLTINQITFGINQGTPILGFSVTLNLSQQSGNGISIGTAVMLKGKVNTTQQTYNGEYPVTHTKTNWQFDKVVMTGFSIDLQTSPFTLKGTVLFKDDDPVYGNGFMGSLELSIKKVMDEPGSVSVCFGSKADYRYFYLDARIPVSIQLGPYITITKFIGGMYYHMTPNKTSEADLITLSKNYSGSSNALSYVPDPNTSLGLKAGMSIILTASEYILNGDNMIEVNFTSSGGLGIVKLTGDVFSMATVKQRAKAPVKGTMVAIYDAPQKTFDFVAAIDINAYNAITGTGSIKIHLDPQIWYFCIGRPASPNNINFFGLSNVPSYFMVGNTLDPPSPLPSAIANNPNFTSIIGKRDANSLKNASGFCSGSRITSSMNKTFGPPWLNMKASYNFDMGWDMMMANYGENAHCEGNGTKVGMNGWLAEGQMFLSMNGNVSINGSYKWPNDCPKSYQTHLVCGPGHCCCVGVTIKCLINGSFSANILSGGINAVVLAKGPKPIYFAGAVNCHYKICEGVEGNQTYVYEYGENCKPVIN